jgi:hypothetical protein
MRQIDRHSLVDKIARELQKRMTYDDIRVYLAGFKFEMGTTKGSYDSKWVYSKDLLARHRRS